MNRIKNTLVSSHLYRLILILNFSVAVVTATIQAQPDTLSFLHITDTHIIYNLESYHPNIELKRKHFGEGIGPLEQFCQSVPKTIKPDFLVITGDMIDFFEAESRHGKMSGTQVEQFIRLLDVNLSPVYLTLGNHDISSYYAEKDSYTGNQFNAGRARAVWIRNTPCFRDGTYYSKVFEVSPTIYRFIFLDNSFYSEQQSTGTLPFIIDKPQLTWLENQMKMSATDVEIIFMHMPLPDNFQDSVQALIPDPAKADLNNLSDLLKINPSARLIFAGHKHTNVIKDFNYPDKHILTQVQTAAFGYDPLNWRLIKLTADRIIISDPGNMNIQLIIPIE